MHDRRKPRSVCTSAEAGLIFFLIILVRFFQVVYSAQKNFRKGILHGNRRIHCEKNPFKPTSDVRKAKAQIRLRGYEYYVRAEI